MNALIDKLIDESAIVCLVRSVGRDFRRIYRASFLYAVLARVFRVLRRECRESWLLHLCRREGALARAWETSLTCRLLTLLVSLPGVLLHRLYLACKTKCDESVLLGLILEAGDGAALLESWAILGLWIIPFRYWDNAYHLLGYLAVLGLLWMRMMRRG